MKHFEKLADNYVQKFIDQKWNEHAVKTFKSDFISGYKAAMEELKKLKDAVDNKTKDYTIGCIDHLNREAE